MATHLHVLEAFTWLYNATRLPIIGRRANELVDIFINNILDPSKNLHMMFTLNWTSVDEAEEIYGFALQAPFLLMEAATVLNRTHEQRLTNAVIYMGHNATEHGFDPYLGGIFERGLPNGTVTRFDHLWWMNADAILGFWWLFSLTNDNSYLDKIEQTLDFIEMYMWDKEHGEWWFSVDQNGTIGDDKRKAQFWKAPYHNLRMALFLPEYIDQYLR